MKNKLKRIGLIMAYISIITVFGFYPKLLLITIIGVITLAGLIGLWKLTGLIFEDDGN